MKKLTKPLAIAAGIAALVVATSTGTAVAGSLITSHDIKDGTIRSVDIKDRGVHFRDLGPRLQAKVLKHAKDGAPGSAAGIQTNWVAKAGSEILGLHTVSLHNAGTDAGASVEIEDLNMPVQAQQEISFTYELHDGAVYGGGAPRVFVEMQGTYINTFDGAPSDAGVDNGDGTFTKTITIGRNGRIGQAGLVMDSGDGSITVTNLTIAGHLIDFS